MPSLLPRPASDVAQEQPKQLRPYPCFCSMLPWPGLIDTLHLLLPLTSSPGDGLKEKIMAAVQECCESVRQNSGSCIPPLLLVLSRTPQSTRHTGAQETPSNAQANRYPWRSTPQHEEGPSSGRSNQLFRDLCVYIDLAAQLSGPSFWRKISSKGHLRCTAWEIHSPLN